MSDATFLLEAKCYILEFFNRTLLLLLFFFFFLVFVFLSIIFRCDYLLGYSDSVQMALGKLYLETVNFSLSNER